MSLINAIDASRAGQWSQPRRDPHSAGSPGLPRAKKDPKEASGPSSGVGPFQGLLLDQLSLLASMAATELAGPPEPALFSIRVSLYADHGLPGPDAPAAPQLDTRA